MTDESLLKLLREKNLTDEEVKLMLKQLEHPPIKHKRFSLGSSLHYKFLLFSDPHIGSLYHREDVAEDTVRVANKEKVDGILLPGDITEGMSNRDGHIYELAIAGVTNQVNYAVDFLNEFKQPIYAILGNHDLMGMKKGNQGVNIGEDLERRVKNLTLLGDMRGDLDINGSTLRLSHEGNTAYSLSYSMQKIINGLPGGDKPGIIANGHLHKGMYMFYRNVHALESMTLQDQTPFMAMKGSPAHVGFSILDIYVNKKGIDKFTPTFYPYYD
mgnify:CR=1 FL=1